MVEGLFSSAFPLCSFPLGEARPAGESENKRQEAIYARTFVVTQVPVLSPLLGIPSCTPTNGGGERGVKRDLFRDWSVPDPPSPIPNLEVKRYSADGT